MLKITPWRTQEPNKSSKNWLKAQATDESRLVLHNFGITFLEYLYDSQIDILHIQMVEGCFKRTFEVYYLTQILVELLEKALSKCLGVGGFYVGGLGILIEP